MHNVSPVSLSSIAWIFTSSKALTMAVLARMSIARDHLFCYFFMESTDQYCYVLWKTQSVGCVYHGPVNVLLKY